MFVRLLKTTKVAPSAIFCPRRIGYSPKQSTAWNLFHTTAVKYHGNNSLFASEAEYDIKAEHFLEDLSSTLDELDDYFEDLDIDYAQGVLTIHLGDEHGTYVLNKQRPNQQIWFSSPTSGPKRFEFNFDSSRWVSTRNGEDLLELLNTEILDINEDIHIDLKNL